MLLTPVYMACAHHVQLPSPNESLFNIHSCPHPCPRPYPYPLSQPSHSRYYHYRHSPPSDFLCRPYKLNRSLLSLSKLLSRRTTPILKYRSSPAAVRPPTYHFSAPIVSRQCMPSLLLSLPLLLAADVAELGVEIPGDASRVVR